MAARSRLRLPYQRTQRDVAETWTKRFGDAPPTFARHLVGRVLDAVTGRVDAGALAGAAESLGVLRAQQGHAIAGLVEDLAALRALLPDGPATSAAVDAALVAATAAYVDELTAILESRATRDPLTGLPNRAAFAEALRHEVAASTREKPPALLLVDLDKFKTVNDTVGHLAGDAVLTAVASLLSAHVRTGDLACRLGGDEFALVLPRTSKNRAAQVAKRLVVAARQAPGLVTPHAKVTLSIGVGWAAHPGTIDELVSLADAPLYRVKAAGGDGVELCGAAELVPA